MRKISILVIFSLAILTLSAVPSFADNTGGTLEVTGPGVATPPLQAVSNTLLTPQVNSASLGGAITGATVTSVGAGLSQLTSSGRVTITGTGTLTLTGVTLPPGVYVDPRITVVTVPAPKNVVPVSQPESVPLKAFPDIMGPTIQPLRQDPALPPLTGPSPLDPVAHDPNRQLSLPGGVDQPILRDDVKIQVTAPESLLPLSAMKVNLPAATQPNAGVGAIMNIQQTVTSTAVVRDADGVIQFK